MQPNSRSRMAIGALVAGSVILASCAGAAESPAPSSASSSAPSSASSSAPSATDVEPANTEPFQFAWTSNITGPAGVVQRIPMDMMLAEFQRLNEAGGIHGRTIEVSQHDAASDTPQMQVDVRQAADDEAVLAVLGLGISGQTEAIVPLLEELQIVGISNPATAPTARSPYYWSAGLNFFGEGQVGGEFLVDEAGAPKVVTIGFDSPGLRASVDGMRSVLEEAGGEVAAEEFLPQTTTDATAAMDGLLAQDPDWIVVSGALDALAASIIDYLKLHDAEDIPMLWLNNGCNTQNMTRANRDNFYAVCHSTAASEANESIEGVAEMREIALENGGESALTGPDDSLVAYGYLLAKAIEAALEECGPDCDREGFRTALATVQVDLRPLITMADFTDESHLAFKQAQVLRWNPSRQGHDVAADYIDLP